MLTDKLNKWKEIQLQINHLQEKQATIAAEIQAEVLTLGKTQKANGVRATYTSGRGTYNYQEAVESREVNPDLMLDLLATFEKVSHDWKKIAEAINLGDEYLKRFYTPGTPSVKLQLED
jgi:predicted HNH restriction endonuclease